MNRIGILLLLGAFSACSASSPRATFALDRAGRPSAQDGASPLASGFWLAGSAPQDYAASVSVDGAGAASGELHATTPPGGEFGTVMTCVDAAAYQGQRLALSATVATKDVGAWAGLWMRVDGAGGRVTAFDNMQTRPITGTSAAGEYQVVLDVDSAASAICYGLLLVDGGSAQLSGLQTRVVDHGVPTTDGGLGNGWFLAGTAPARYLSTLAFAGDGSAQGSLASRDSTVSADDFGTIMTELDATPYRGHGVRLRGRVAPANVDGWAGLWVRVDDADGNTLAFDNMEDRPIRGSGAALDYAVALPVDASAATVSFGILVAGSGEVDFSGLGLDATR